MAIKHHTIPPAGTIGAIDQPQWAEGHDVDAGGITFADATVLTSAGPFTGTSSGLAPASGGGTTNFLRADGTWAAPTGGAAYPGTLKDLVLWWESDNILATTGNAVSALQNLVPASTGAMYANAGYNVPVVGAALNGLPTVTWGTAGGCYNICSGTEQGILLQNGVTMFCVVNPVFTTTQQVMVGGMTGSIAFMLSNGDHNLHIWKTGAGGLAASTTAWTSGTWLQANFTFDNANTLNYAFRMARAAAGSGTAGVTGSQSAGQVTTSIGVDLNSSAQYVVESSSLAALIVYNRVLSNSEITNVENYLFNKWGV